MSAALENIYSLTPDMAIKLLVDNGFKPEQAVNIFKDIYRSHARSYQQMEHTSKAVVQLLSQHYDFTFPLELVETRQDSDTVKFLFSLVDGGMIETVIMRQKYGSSVCVSTQNGCNMGCVFCASGRYKKQRNLTIGEIAAQVLYAMLWENGNVNNITVMGIGEPFDNYPALCGFLQLAAYPYALGIGEKHITVSTCGVVPGIYEFAKRENPCLLAISLHAPEDNLRSKLLPINNKYPLAELIKAAEYYTVKCNRRVLLEYILLSGVNDTPQHARQLAQLIGDRRFFVNLIPYNDSGDGKYSRSDKAAVMAFYDILKKANIGVTLRREFGSDLAAACGQLRGKRINLEVASDEI